MGRQVQKQVGDVAYHVNRLTVGEIYQLFEGKADPPPADQVDLIGGALFEEMPLEDVLTFTDLTRDQVMGMDPDDVASVIAEIKGENPRFFGLLARLRREIARNLDAFPAGSSPPSAVQSSP
jgi:hypothetical protein